MKRPEGFDDRPATPDEADAVVAPRGERRAPFRARRPSRGRPVDGLEARGASSADRPVGDGVTPDTLGADTARAMADRPLTDEAAPDVAATPRARAGVFAGAAGRRFGEGLSSVAERLRELTPDEEFRDPDARASRDGAHGDGADRIDDGDHDATITDVIDPHRASRPDHHDEAPIGAGVRAAETAREARLAKRRRRLLERAEVRRFTRRSRHRRAAWITAAGVVLVLGVSILVAVFSPLMALQRIEIKGTNRVDQTALRQALSDQIGTPLARLDFGAIKRDIAGFPLIESYVTEEAPPHTLVVTVTERTPVVAVKTGSSYSLVDPAGIVVQSSPKQPATMPVADVGRAKLGSPVFRTMTEVVLSLPSTVRAQVASVRASTADDVTLTMKDKSTVVWGSPDESVAKAALLAALVKDHASRNPGTAVEYDVSAPDNGIIRAKH
ncbi:FtsQ-type POTRA domain-containing protein [Curtobacterium sp. ISL-83]|uniref:FtsQ-type POTRA domain-containing protein n=1 Tax=Curtobacterium sp. ISL-83 TaxID=2819145 RepID=UPI001BE72C75|nr:FtsQ-type POTRA domain-containing protein [Curtobacterium sp. ISL-83]MBT2503982.1 FtsQ-type POTRA domain-containing protein [Curtobacterium sp. ISL-83]